MRATATNQTSAMIMGIDVPKVFSYSWVHLRVISVFGGIVLQGLHHHTHMANFGLKGASAVVLEALKALKA